MTTNDFILAKSPVFSHLTATLLGISTIRSRELQSHLAKEFDTLQDVHSGTWQLAVSANTALGLWLDFVSTAFVACVTYSFIVLYDGKFLSATEFSELTKTCLISSNI